jgi:hypothetical protein
MADASSFLSPWSNFYVIVGSSAGALTGLQFVVIALVAQAEALGSSLEIRAFGTPTVVHFCVALLISAIANAPWHALSSAAWALSLCGAGGAGYVLTLIRHARNAAYSPDTGDWLWYVGLPITTYATLLAAGILLPLHPHGALCAVGATSLALLFIGIHNAWDTVTYVALMNWGKDKAGKSNPE